MSTCAAHGPPWLIMFDCDGTLIDSQHGIVAAMDMAFATEGLTAPSRARTLGIVGLSLSEAMLALVPDADSAQIARLVESYKTAFTHIRSTPEHSEPMYPGMRDVISQLRGRDDVLLGIATGKARRGVNVFLEREGFEDVFCSIKTADDAPSKPHPGMLLQALSETGCNAGAAVMVGDTTFDILMARAAGMQSVAVGWGYHDAAQLKGAGADLLVDAADELPTAFERLLVGFGNVAVEGA